MSSIHSIEICAAQSHAVYIQKKAARGARAIQVRYCDVHLDGVLGGVVQRLSRSQPQFATHDFKAGIINSNCVTIAEIDVSKRQRTDQSPWNSFGHSQVGQCQIVRG